jgi:predicted NBD/HSP70 family sugar kinase
MKQPGLPSLLFPRSRQVTDLRTANTVSVLYDLLTHRHLSRKELIRSTGLAPSTVSGITAELLELGIIKRVGILGGTSAGRKAELLSRNPKAASLAAVHLTPESCRIGILDLGYKFLAKEEIAFPEGFKETDTQALISELRSLVKENARTNNMIAVGVALPDHPFDNQQIVDSFRSAFPCSIVHMNNVEAMAMYEYYDRLSKRVHTAVFIYIGTGIGSGLIIDGSLYKGVTGRACDLGHTYITDEPILCRCGRRGCLETVASELSLGRALAGRYGLDPAPVRDELIDLISTNLQKGDAFTISLLEKAAFYLGKGIFNLIVTLDPQQIVVTGRVNRLNPLFSNLVERAYLDHARQGDFPIVPLEFIDLRDEAGLKGAAMFSFISLLCGADNRSLIWHK